MLKVTDDRTSAIRDLMESLGGSLIAIYWSVEDASAFTLADLPDPVTAAAIITAVTRTGSVVGVEAHELLTQEQLHDALVLGRDSSKVYRAPGSKAIERDTVSS
jgi:uncharacterized protein with GYD domain